MATAADLIDQAAAATTAEELDAIEAQAEGRVTVLQAVADARAELGLTASEEPAPADAEQPAQQNDWYGHTTEPDFVWIGCGECWTPKDYMRPVRGYAEWLSDGHRRMNYICEGCTKDVFPSLWGMWIEDAHPWVEGGIVPEATEVQVWGQ